MTSDSTKRKMFIIATGIFVITMSSVLFLVKENKLDIHNEDGKAFILSDYEIKTPKTEDFYRDLLENDNDDLIVLDNDSTVEFSSDELSKKLGYVADEVKDQDFLTLVHPGDIPELVNVFIEDDNNDENTNDQSIGPIWLEASSGEYKPYIISMKYLEDEEGEKISTALVLKDISKAVGEEDEVKEKEIVEIIVKEIEKEVVVKKDDKKVKIKKDLPDQSNDSSSDKIDKSNKSDNYEIIPKDKNSDKKDVRETRNTKPKK